MITRPQTVRIAHVTTIDMAVRFFLLDHLLELKRLGYEVNAVCSDGPWVSDVRAKGIPVHTIPMRRAVSPFADLLALWRLYRSFCRGHYLIVQTHTPKANLLGQMAAWMARVPIRIKTAHGFYLDVEWPSWKKLFYVLIERVSSATAHWVFVVSRADFSLARRARLCAERKLRYLGAGIDLSRFRREEHLVAAEALRQELGFPPGAPVVGIVARLSIEKGYVEFIEAAGLVHQQRPEVRFVAVGPEDVMTGLQLYKLVNNRQFNDCFRFVGMQLDMPKFYAMMTLLVLPSYREGTPRVVIEAAAMALPVVASDIGGCREIVKPGETGLLVPARDGQALGRAILELLEDPERARKMGEKARAKAEREFDERGVFSRLRESYAQLIAPHRQVN